MARLVGLPCGVAVQLVLDGVIAVPGVHAPYTAEICEPIREAVEREGLHLEDGRIVKGPCIFLEGKVFLWNVPPAWEGWKEEHFDIFKVVVPKPGMSYSSFSIVDWMYT